MKPGNALHPEAHRAKRSVVAMVTLVAACRPQPAGDGAPVTAKDAAADASAAPAPSPAPPPSASTRAVGPYEVPFAGTRNVYFVVPRSTQKPARLFANLHGVCNPPGYACGYWVQAASARGFLVCPEGNTRCGGKDGPTSWSQPMVGADDDLEKAIAVVDAKYPGEVSREGSVLTGFSLGAYAAVAIALKHPGRWPYLILNEANVALDSAALTKAGVRAVALIAGEHGSQIAGERATTDKLQKAGYPAKFWVMKGAGHHYSADIDAIMAEAIDFVLSH